MRKIIIVSILVLAGCGNNPHQEGDCSHWDLSSALKHHGKLTIIHVGSRSITTKDCDGRYIEVHLMDSEGHGFTAADIGKTIQ